MADLSQQALALAAEAHEDQPSKLVVHHFATTPLPLSPHSFLAWAGVSDEGTPVIMDSAGILRMMHFKMGYNWTVVLNTKAHVRGKSDHHFVLGLNEKQGVVRSVLCKGSRYPSILPRPHVTLLHMQIPICELETEKGGLEEK